MNTIEIDLERMNKDFKSRKNNITEILQLKSIVARKRNMLFADSNDFMQSRERVLKSLERVMFTQEMKVMAIALLELYGDYTSDTYYYRNSENKLIKRKGLSQCLISSHGLHLTLSSLNE